MEKEIIKYNDIEFYKIPNIEGYFVSKCGKVYSSKRGGRIMKLFLDKYGYEYVCLQIKGYERKVKIHRLVAITFLNLPVDDRLYSISKLTVNHINEIKNDNRLENLEVITPRENSLHSAKNKIGVKGVHAVKNTYTNPFQTKISINYKQIHLGVYPTAEDAGKIYQLALQNIHLFDNDKKKFRELIKNAYQIEKEYI